MQLGTRPVPRSSSSHMFRQPAAPKAEAINLPEYLKKIRWASSHLYSTTWGQSGAQSRTICAATPAAVLPVHSPSDVCSCCLHFCIPAIPAFCNYGRRSAQTILYHYICQHYSSVFFFILPLLAFVFLPLDFHLLGFLPPCSPNPNKRRVFQFPGLPPPPTKQPCPNGHLHIPS